jgi:hypothetical protein
MQLTSLAANSATPCCPTSVRHILSAKCPDEDTLAAFVDGQLGQHESAEVIVHFATCLRCRVVILALIQSKATIDPDTPGPD